MLKSLKIKLRVKNKTATETIIFFNDNNIISDFIKKLKKY